MLLQIVKSVVQPIRFTKSDNSRIVFDETVMNTFSRYKQNSHGNLEAGGLLLGRHLAGGTHLAVDIISEPMNGDRRTRTSFFRGRGHELFAHKCWQNSKGTCAYLGNWHTHPCIYPNPSETDFNDWRNVLENDIYEGVKLYFIIVGTQELSCWEGCAQNGNFIKLEEYIFP